MKFGHPVYHHKSNVLIFLFICCCSIAIWSNGKSVQKYLLYDIKTSVIYSHANNLQFPAITMCNTNMFRRSIVGGSKLLMAGLVKFFSQSQRSFEYLYEKNVATCKPDNDTVKGEILDEDPLTMLNDLGFDGIIYKLGMNSEISLNKCWWQNEIINCSQFVTNHFTDKGLCFTMKLASSENVIYKTLIGSNQDNFKINQDLSKAKSGPNNGLKLLLNVHQDEYCGFWWDFGGNGFRCYIHDTTKVETFNSDQGLINIHSGKSYNIVLKPRYYRKDTEFMGRCKSKMTLKNLDVTGDYLNSMCVFLCYVQYINGECSCLPIVVKAKNIDKIIKVLNINSTSGKICEEMDDLLCFNTHTEQFLFNYEVEMCTHCLPQCTEMVYDQIISESVYPPKSSNQFNEKTFEKMKKNDIILNIYFENSFVETVTESQRYTFFNLLMSIGGNFCLLVGASFVTLFLPLYSSIYGLQKLLSRTKIFHKLLIRMKKAKVKKNKVYSIRLRTFHK